MCVAQFRDYCNASKFQGDFDNQYEKDVNNKYKRVGIYLTYENQTNHYYVTDLKKMDDLAKNGNPYAIREMDNEC